VQTNVGGSRTICAFHPRRVHLPFVFELGWPETYVAIEVHAPGSACVRDATSSRGGCNPMSRVPSTFVHPNRSAITGRSCAYGRGHRRMWP